MSVRHQPVIYVIGGPNGAGKTTFARQFLPAAGVMDFLNADLLAAGLSPLSPGAMAMRSARLILSRWRELVSLRRNFAFESTLSGRTYAGMLQGARDAGYQVRMCYLWLPSVSLSLQRVRQRARKGGHDVPAVDVRRRFVPSLRNFFTRYLELADEAILFDSSVSPPALIARWAGGTREVSLPREYEVIEAQTKAAHPGR